MNRRSEIKIVERNWGGDTGIAPVFSVLLYENDELVETRALPGRSIHYAEDVAENWENGIIKTGEKSLNEK